MALVGWSGPPSKSGRLLMTLLKPACAAQAIASGSSCGATQTSALSCWSRAVVFMARERLLDGGRDQRHVGLAGQARLDRAHHLAHVARALRAELGDDCADLGSDRLGAQALRQVGFENAQFGTLLRDQVRPVAGRELGDRVLALLYQLVDDRDDGGVVEHDALVDLALLAGREQAADGQQPRRVLRAHRGLHVFGDLFLEGHGGSGGVGEHKRESPRVAGFLGNDEPCGAQPREIRTASSATACCERA